MSPIFVICVRIKFVLTLWTKTNLLNLFNSSYKNPQEVRPVGFVVAVLPATWERRNRRKSSWGRVILLK